MEKAFIAQLQTQGYEYLPIKSETDLIHNLREQLEQLQNRISPLLDREGSEERFNFSNKEWTQFFKTKIANQNSGIEEKTTIIQEDFIQLLTRDNGETKNIYLIDKQNIHNNSLQVVNQYTVVSDEGILVSEIANNSPLTTNHSPLYTNRYDVTVLVNGLPLVHIELKRRGVDIKEAFNQIDRYQRESFWTGSGLYEYIQLFVISNGTYTKYYSNTTRNQHIKEQENK